ncbi:EH signature domain-containing protein [Ruegeria arenilitoris]|uniref:EH signature domain-containing protein n=1 Tax=Ruegeria arenilitoris TaxID=1173585 RepID=UPI00147C56EC|nr:EH signature domain-containing protein [Ruegeria arenilitoris]
MRLSEVFAQKIEPTSVVLPAPKRLETAVDRVLKRWPDVFAEPSENDRETLVAELKRRLDDWSWSGAKISFVNQAAVALFDLERRSRADLEHVRKFYYEEAATNRSRTFLGNAVQVYIGSFVKGAVHTRRLSEALTNQIPHLSGRSRKLLKSFPAFFDSNRIAMEVASRMKDAERPFQELKRLGFNKPHAPGLLDHAHLEFLEKLDLRTHTDIEKLFHWLHPDGQLAKQGGASEAIEALLAPWLDEDPQEDVKRFLIDHLTESYGDIRINPGSAWINVSEQAKQVLLRWLTGESMRFLFDVLTDTQDSHMWSERRRFWMDQYDRGNISAAWVAFDPRGHKLARKNLGREKNLPFGRQVSHASDDGNKSLLIMKVGQRIIVEGTYNFKVHIYAKNDPEAPKLYQPKYDCADIRHDRRKRVSSGFVKIGPEERKMHLGDWQGYLRSRYPEMF